MISTVSLNVCGHDSHVKLSYFVTSAMSLSPYKRTYISAFLSVAEQILHNIKQEYKRLQKRRHLDSAFQQADGCCPLDLQNIHSGSALPGTTLQMAHLNEDIE